MELRIINQMVADNACGLIQGLPQDGSHIVTISTHKLDRSAQQNALSHVWYGEIAKGTGSGRKHERSFCKLVYGIPILLGGEGNKKAADDFIEFYRLAINPLGYEDKLKAMGFTPVTSLMSVKQFAEYLTTVQRETLIHHGIQLSVMEIYRDALG